MNNEERRIQAGELEKVKAAEETQRRNAITILAQLQMFQGAIKEMGVRLDVLQNHYLNQQKLFEQQRLQLARLQQEFYARGSTSYSNGEG